MRAACVLHACRASMHLHRCLLHSALRRVLADADLDMREPAAPCSQHQGAPPDSHCVEQRPQPAGVAAGPGYAAGTAHVLLAGCAAADLQGRHRQQPQQLLRTRLSGMLPDMMSAPAGWNTALHCCTIMWGICRCHLLASVTTDTTQGNNHL